MRVLWIVLAVAVAVVLQTMLARYAIGGFQAVDLVLVVVVGVSLVTGPVSGMLTGSVAGIIQDALSSGIVGIGGLAKATTGLVCGAIARQFVVTMALPRVVMFFVATVVHAVMFMGLYTLLDLQTFTLPWATVSIQGLTNCVAGVAALTIIERLPVVLERRRARQTLWR